MSTPTEITKIAGPAKLQMAPDSTESQQLSKRKKKTESQLPRFVVIALYLKKAFTLWFGFILGLNSIFLIVSKSLSYLTMLKLRYNFSKVNLNNIKYNYIMYSLDYT